MLDERPGYIGHTQLNSIFTTPRFGTVISRLFFDADMRKIDLVRAVLLHMPFIHKSLNAAVNVVQSLVDNWNSYE